MIYHRIFARYAPIFRSWGKETAWIKPETVNIRIKPEERSLIDRAAESRGKTRTDFILDAARLAAEEKLLDQVIVSANPQAYAEFLARLDAATYSTAQTDPYKENKKEQR